MSQQDDSKAAFARCLSAQAYAEAAAGHYPEAIDVLERSDKLLRASVGPKHVGIFVNCGFRATTELRRGRPAEDNRALDSCVTEAENALLLAWHKAPADRMWTAHTHVSAAHAVAARHRNKG